MFPRREAAGRPNRPAPFRFRGGALGVAVVSWVIRSAAAAAQTPSIFPAGPAPTSQTEASLPSDASPGSLPASLGHVLKDEAHRYVRDTADILFAPLHWSRRSWVEAAVATAAIAAVGHEDAAVEGSIQRHRSSATNSVSRAVTPLGSAAGVGLSFAALGGGLLFHDPAVRDLGRDAVEAELISGGIVTPVIKRVLGRTRPGQGGDADEYRPFSSRQSFPSGHTTEAFTLASVVATRSRGWVVPTVAYGLASVVGLSRMNDRAHYASDVLAGAVIGTVVGRTIVHRHSPDAEKVSAWSVVPLGARRGAGIALRFESGPGSS